MGDITHEDIFPIATIKWQNECSECESTSTEDITGCTKCGAVDSMGSNGVLACSACGSTDFVYEEKYPTQRTMSSNEDGKIAFYSDFDWSEGDSNPGIVCTGCGYEFGNPEDVEIDWV